MSSSGAMASITKLKGRENYETWKFAVRAYLEMEDLWSCVEGTNEEAEEKADNEADAKKNNKVKQWRSRN